MDSTLQILAGSVVAVIVIYVLHRLITTPKNLPPGPFAWPIIGALPYIGKYPQRGLLKLSEKYGPVMSVWFGQKLVIVATSPEAATEFLRTQDANFCARPKHQVCQILMPHDITFSDVSAHTKYLRKLVQGQFSTTKRMEDAQKLRSAEIAYLVRTIPTEGMVNVKFHIETLIGNIFSQLVLSKRLVQPTSYEVSMTTVKKFDADAGKLRDLMTMTSDIDRSIGTFNAGDFIPAMKSLNVQGLNGRFQRFKEKMDAFVAVIIHERLTVRQAAGSAYESKDYLDALLDEIDVKDNEIDLTTVRSMIWEIFAAGMETNIASTEWAMSELVQNPDVMKKAQAQLDAVVGRDRLVHDTDIPKLTYIKAIVKESFRFHPPIAFLPRKAIQSTKAFGYDIPQGANVFVNMWGMGRLESVYPEPMRFNPDRFLPGGANANLDLQGQSMELLPFGSGRRVCPGMPVGYNMVQSAVATLLHSFNWTAPEGHSLMEGTGEATLYKATPLRARAERRLPQHLYN